MRTSQNPTGDYGTSEIYIMCDVIVQNTVGKVSRGEIDANPAVVRTCKNVRCKLHNYLSYQYMYMFSVFSDYSQ